MLSTELSKRSNGRTIYILDEPTTGLHIADVDRLIGVLQRLIDAGSTVVIIEHNLDVIKTADYIIILTGVGTGRNDCCRGAPRDYKTESSYTGSFKTILESRILERV